MAQFTVYRNRSARTRSLFPFLVDVQSDLLADLQTRVVIPMSRLTSLTRKPIEHLTPAVQFEGDLYVLVTPELAGIARDDLGSVAGSLAPRRDAILASLDFLLLGF